VKEVRHKVDFCVVGGGLSGMCAAIAAARHGAKVALVHDRPVLGGNASSEIRMHVCGAHGEYNRETGIIEELKLENRYRNPLGNYSIWDSILYEKVRFEPNIMLLLNCSVCDLTTQGARIISVKGWQLTTYTWHVVEADYFADCSGDSILAPESGAEYREGREARSEFDEPIAPEKADSMTMGLSCLIEGRETETPHEFIPPEWAYRYEEDGSLPNRGHQLTGSQNFWWIEVGGSGDTIHDTEEMRDELLKIAFGVWDHIKNRDRTEARNWVLEWAGFLPGKRESRRYVGDHILNQHDVEAEGRHFEDTVAYGGWTMDDHFPEGFYKKEAGTIFHPAPSPYGIPYRSLYSKNIENLFFAGRNISATHTALSSTRVMATCAVIGQAVGTAAWLAVESGITPRRVYEQRLAELKQTLMDDDCYLPFNVRTPSELTQKAKVTVSGGGGVGEVVRNGIERPLSGEGHYLELERNGWIEFAFDNPVDLADVRVVFDSDLQRETDGRMPSKYTLQAERGGEPRVTPLPGFLVKAFRIEVADSDGRWREAARCTESRLRLVRLPLNGAAGVSACRFIPEATWGDECPRLFAFDVYPGRP
jgi:hypothetical protein